MSGSTIIFGNPARSRRTVLLLVLCALVTASAGSALKVFANEHPATNDGEHGEQKAEAAEMSAGTVITINAAPAEGQIPADSLTSSSVVGVETDQQLVGSSRTAHQDVDSVQDKPGMCLVVEGLLADFCSQYPNDSGCLAIQQLNSQ